MVYDNVPSLNYKEPISELLVRHGLHITVEFLVITLEQRVLILSFEKIAVGGIAIIFFSKIILSISALTKLDVIKMEDPRLVSNHKGIRQGHCGQDCVRPYGCFSPKRTS